MVKSGLKGFRAKLKSFNFHPLELVSHYSVQQLQVDENYLNLFNLRPFNPFTILMFKTNLSFRINDFQ